MSQIQDADFNLHKELHKAEQNLAAVSSHFQAIAESLDGQVFWNNTKRISEDLFKDYFNMSMQVQSGINNLTDFIEKLGDEERAIRKQGARKDQRIIEVSNAQTNKLNTALD